MNTWHGNHITLSIFGESHGEGVGAVCDGLPAGIPLDFSHIEHMLSLRRPKGGATTARAEKDEYEILSGVSGGKTNGAPLCVFFRNKDVKRADYNPKISRPSHADFPAFIKYGGLCDLSGGGHFSARLTAPLVFIGAICESELKKRGIRCSDAIRSVGDVDAGSFYDTEITDELLARLDTDLPLINPEKKTEIDALLLRYREEKNTIGATVELCMTGLPTGAGEPFFDSVESRLSSLMFSIPAVKGVEFGKGFELSTMRGSDANDEYDADGVRRCLEGDKTAKVCFSNNSGGICGGLTTSMPLIMRVAFKPIASVGTPQRSFYLDSLRPTELVIEGRHDVCAALRGAVVVRALACIGMIDLL